MEEIAISPPLMRPNGKEGVKVLPDRGEDVPTVNRMRDLYKEFKDPTLFSERCLSVRDPRGNVVDWVNRKAQEKLDQAVREAQAAGKPKRFYILKSRRHGISAKIACYGFRQIFDEGQNVLILAHQKVAARNLFNFYDHFDQTYKPFDGLIKKPLREIRIAGKEQGALGYENDSRIECGTASNIDFSRSFNIRFVHASEYAFYWSIGGLMTALVAAVPDDPGTAFFRETTANGYNLAYNDWIEAMEGRSNYTPMFFGCFDDEQNIVPLTMEPEQFQASLRDEEWELIERHGLALEQIAWRRGKLADYRGDVSAFDQEYPNSWEVAFRSSGRQRFDPKLFVWMPLAEGSKGHLVREKVDRKLEVVYRPSSVGELEVWHRPQKNRDYVGGCDPCKGVDVNEGVGAPNPDFAGVEVFDREACEQVAELHARLEPTVLARYLFDIGEWYGWVYWVVETGFDGGNGLAVCRELERLGYPMERIHFHLRMDRRTQRPTKQIGFEIRPNTRPVLVSDHERLLLDGQLIFHSSMLVNEHKTFVKKASGKEEHEDGCHDDLLFGAMYATQGIIHAPVKRFLAPREVKPAKYKDVRPGDDRLNSKLKRM